VKLLQESRFISHKGFVFSVDAAVSIILLITSLFLFTQSSFVIPNSFDNSLQVGQDTITTLGRTGFLNETLDTNSLVNSANLIRQRFLTSLPPNLDARIQIKDYTLDANSCRTPKNFSSCFLQTPPATAASGPAIPEKEVFSSKKLIILGQAAGNCDLSVELMPQQKNN